MPQRRGPVADGAVGSGPGSHQHLWRLPDGTGLHAPPGRLLRDGAGRVCCHLCGRWFPGLAWHLRVHGYTAAEYRAAVGLCRGEPLVGPAVSERIARRQARAYRGSPEMRERLAPGQELARSGALAGLGRAALDGSGSARRASVRRAALDAGRRTRARRRAEDLAARLAALGHPGGAAALPGYLRTAYAAGASVAALAGATGLGRARLRAAMLDAGIAIRAPGHTSVDGRRSRARSADAAAAARVGTDDLAGWLRERHDRGWSLVRLARAVGHSTHWVRLRLEPPGHDTGGTATAVDPR